MKKIIVKSVLFAGISLNIVTAGASVHGRVDGALRMRPTSYNAVGLLAYDGLLWGEGDKTKPTAYGFYRVGAKAGGSPTAAALVQIAPVAPLVFEVQKGTALRFFKLSATDCDQYECHKNIERTDYSVRLGAAYKKFIFSLKGTWREIKTANSTKSVYLELESFHVNPGYYTYFEANTAVGYKLDELRTTGLIYIGGVISDGDRDFKSIYGFYSQKHGDYSFTGAAGYYDAQDLRKYTGLSLLALVGWSFGENLSLW